MCRPRIFQNGASPRGFKTPGDSLAWSRTVSGSLVHRLVTFSCSMEAENSRCSTERKRGTPLLSILILDFLSFESRLVCKDKIGGVTARRNFLFPFLPNSSKEFNIPCARLLPLDPSLPAALVTWVQRPRRGRCRGTPGCQVPVACLMLRLCQGHSRSPCLVLSPAPTVA